MNERARCLLNNSCAAVRARRACIRWCRMTRQQSNPISTRIPVKKSTTALKHARNYHKNIQFRFGHKISSLAQRVVITPKNYIFVFALRERRKHPSHSYLCFNITTKAAHQVDAIHTFLSVGWGDMRFFCFSSDGFRPKGYKFLAEKSMTLWNLLQRLQNIIPFLQLY